MGPMGDIQEIPTPIDDLNLLESSVLLSSTPQTLAASRNTLVTAFHLSGNPFGIVEENDV